VALFLSTFANKIDAKGRVSVPVQFRASLVNPEFSGMILYDSFTSDCVEGCDIARIRKISESIDNLDQFSNERDSLAAALLGSCVQLTIDSDGRVILPENLLKKAKIKDVAVFVGKGSVFEIWEPKKLEEHMAKAKKDARSNINLLKVVK
jgi:MraZ protein